MTVQENKTSSIQEKRLSVQLSLNGLSFWVYTEKKETLFLKEKKTGYRTSPEELLILIQEIVRENPILNSSFSKISLIYATTPYCLVPVKFFDKTKASEYLKFNSKILANDYLEHDVIEKENSVIVYIPLMNINNFFFENYGEFAYFHAVDILLNSLPDKDRPDPAVYLHFYENHFDCIVFENKKLLLCNSFHFHTAEDFLYYTLFVMEQLQLDPDQVSVYLSGIIDKSDSKYKLAYNYIRNLEFLKPETSVSEDESHRYFLLKNIE